MVISSNSLDVLPVGSAVKSPTNGYFETGIVANKIISHGFSTFGFGVYYRYGNYRFKDFEDNLAFKVTLLNSF